ncbi:hypothetical protein MUO74_05430 [Candidatus Bathyarchaeota archaeon]|nr:hypothetical protein [Candidatus Bathyarchaeota archaeon]
MTMFEQLATLSATYTVTLLIAMMLSIAVFGAYLARTSQHRRHSIL